MFDADESRCAHENFEIENTIHRMTDVVGGPATAFSVDVRVRCADCHRLFFFDGITPGYSLDKPTCDPFGVEARLPLTPAGDEWTRKQCEEEWAGRPNGTDDV